MSFDATIGPVLHETVQRTFGQEVTHHPAGGVQQVARGVFTRSFERVELTNSGPITSYEPVLDIWLDDYTADPAPGDEFTIGSDRYAVVEVQEDSQRGARVRLQNA